MKRAIAIVGLMALAVSVLGQGAPVRKFKHYDHTTHGTPDTALSLGRAEVSILSLVSTGTTVTASSVGAHQYQTGERVSISGAAQHSYNGTHTITKTGATNFTYVVGSTPSTSPATGTIVANQTNLAESVIIHNPGTNSISIGPNDSASLYTLTSGDWYEIPITKKDGRFDIRDWYSKSASASQTLRILYF